VNTGAVFAVTCCASWDRGVVRSAESLQAASCRPRAQFHHRIKLESEKRKGLLFYYLLNSLQFWL